MNVVGAAGVLGVGWLVAVLWHLLGFGLGRTELTVSAWLGC